MKYYKILREDELHHGVQYKDGLVIDPVTFNPEGTCVPGGIYFASKDILAVLGYGPWIREVTIPDDAQMVKDPDDYVEKFRADKVILGPRRKITAEVIQELIDEGADVRVGGDYALRWASGNGHVEVVKVLLEAGADVQANRDEALRFAGENGHVEAVKVLLENGADVHAEDKEDKSVLWWASGNGHVEVVKVLLEAGADVQTGDCTFYWASMNGHQEVVKILKEHTVTD